MMLTRIPQQRTPGTGRVVATTDGGISVREYFEYGNECYLEVQIGKARFTVKGAQGSIQEAIGNAILSYSCEALEIDGRKLDCWIFRADHGDGRWVEIRIPLDNEYEAVLEGSSEELTTAAYLNTQMWTQSLSPEQVRTNWLILMGLLLLSGIITWICLT